MCTIRTLRLPIWFVFKPSIVLDGTFEQTILFVGFLQNLISPECLAQTQKFRLTRGFPVSLESTDTAYLNRTSRVRGSSCMITPWFQKDKSTSV